MSTNRSRRIDRAAAEQLFDGVAGVPAAGQDPSSAGQRPAPDRTGLAALLAAAAAPGPDGEGPLPGEEEALAAFRRARHQPAPRQHRRRKMADTALARALSAKALAVALGVTAVGSVAVAAGTGHLPTVLGGPAPARPSASEPADGQRTDPAAGPDTPSAAPSARATRPSGTATGHEPTGRPSGSASAGAAQLPDLPTLCRGFAARVAAGTRPKEAAVDPALAALLQEAGGPEKVAGYCALLAARAAGAGGDGRKPTAVPTQPANQQPAPSPSPSAGKGGRTDPTQSRTPGKGDDQD
ncbi:hypothetical protein ACIQBJ_12075 [Kitasatospora sp. NPDC088391]|uniref:hypothetical protein n=1 Tax=Kitasatospora sp. NPDC088391 TaxID=3364074 RepID=UPI003824E6A3